MRYLPTWSRILLAVLGLLAGSFAPASAGAEEPASLFFGVVVPNAHGQVATKVRAIGDGGVVCGTADVSLIGEQEQFGYYELSVVPAAQRSGCPHESEPVTLVVLFGDVGDGALAETKGPAVFRAGTRQQVAILVAGSQGVGWAGTPPPPGGQALMIWVGPSDFPVEVAAGTLGIDVAAIFHLNAARQRFDAYVPGGPAFVQTYLYVQTGDVVVVRAR